MSAPVFPAGGSLFEPGEEIIWWMRPTSGGSHRGYLIRRFARSLTAFGIAGVALVLTFAVALPLLGRIHRDVSLWVLPLLVAAGLVIAAGVLLTAVGLLRLLIPEPACPPPPRVVADLLYVVTDRRLLVLRASRGSGRAYEPNDLAPTGAAEPTYRVDRVRPGVGNVLVGVPGPAGWIPRISLWLVPDPDRVVDRLRSWTGTGRPADDTASDVAGRAAADPPAPAAEDPHPAAVVEPTHPAAAVGTTRAAAEESSATSGSEERVVGRPPRRWADLDAKPDGPPRQRDADRAVSGGTRRAWRNR